MDILAFTARPGWPIARKKRFEMSVCASNFQERILSKISVDENGCWNWTGCKNSEGYGKLTIGSRSDGTRRTVKAHRASYAAFVGEIPAGKDICHKCDNPSCVNPEHLFPGTEKDNVADMDAKGRRGFVLSENHPKAKLTEKDVIEARELRKQGFSYYKLAKMYGVYRETMRRAVLGKTWQHMSENRQKPEEDDHG